MKFSGKVGFWEDEVEVRPGVFKSDIVEKPYTGDVIKNYRRFQNASDQQNENLMLSNVRISIISDLYMRSKWASIRYIVWNNVRWSVTSVDISSYPRAILDLGGVYNGTDSIT